MALNDPIIAVERITAIVKLDPNADPLMTLRMSEFIEELTRQVNHNTLASGTGSPEGVLSAEPLKRYFDTAAAAGSNFYIKKTGSGLTGWQLV